MTAIPYRMSRLPRDKRGYPIPYAQFIDNNGVPDFRVIDEGKAVHCCKYRLCFMCGEKLGRHIFFVGGPACAEHGVFYDGPMHKECAEFAITTCPHLARSKGRYADAERIKEEYAGEAKITVGEMNTEKCEWYGLMHATDYKSGMFNGMLAFQAKLPWIEVVRYRDGAPITEKETA